MDWLLGVWVSEVGIWGYSLILLALPGLSAVFLFVVVYFETLLICMIALSHSTFFFHFFWSGY